MCTPCSPGVAPCTSTITITPEPPGVTRAVPVTLLLLRDSSVAVAAVGVTGSGAATAGVGAAATVPASAAVDDAGGDDAVAQAHARITSSNERRIGTTSGFGAANPSEVCGSCRRPQPTNVSQSFERACSPRT